MSESSILFWFRRDLRLADNAGLYHALKQGKPVVPVFIFDTDILDDLEDKADARLTFIHRALTHLQKELEKSGSTLIVRRGKPIDVWRDLLREFSPSAVYVNHDYEPYARRRDEAVANLLRENSIAFHSFKDQAFFEKSEVLKDDGTPYTVFTPYKTKWFKKYYTRRDFYSKAYPSEKYLAQLEKRAPEDIPTLNEIGFRENTLEFPPIELPEGLLRRYAAERDIPSLRGTSRLGVHLRFGTVSVRGLVREALPFSETFVNELIWRDFFMMILWHFPQVVDRSFRSEYDRISWRNDAEDFERWCEGRTGYPLVDAGMRELNTTGFMHNRVRMVVASFLCKHLLIDWRWGEAYFAKKLLDYDLAANNGNWQWSAGSGCDAAPYFRIFNPAEQLKKFDPQLQYVKKWIPEFGTNEYPLPIVEHKLARERCLGVYKKALG